MLFKTLLRTPDDAALWGNPGRIPAIYVAPNDSHIVIATDCRLTNPGSDDLNKGDDYRIGYMVSTDGGITFSTLAYAIDEHLTTDNTGTGIGFGDPMLMPTAGGAELYLFATSDKDAPTGSNPGTGTGKAPIAYSKATLAGGFTDWSPVAFFPLMEGETNNSNSGNGYYDEATETNVVLYCNYISGWKPRPLYKVGAGPWTLGQNVPTVSANETEFKVIKSEDGFWYLMSRIIAPAQGQPMPLYRSASIGGPWEPVSNAGKIFSVSNNFGLCKTEIAGAEAWLYSGSDYPTTQIGSNPNFAIVRRKGRLKLSFDKGRSWRNIANLTGGDTARSDDFFGYSCVVASNNNIYVVFESNNYTSIRLCKIAKSELTI